MSTPKKVVVAMSGGVDSSVAAALLKEQGYEVIGVTLRLSDWEETEGKKFGGCCGSKDFYDARSVAQALDIPHYAFDHVQNFRQSVIGYFKDSYQAGETPNPCIACNKFVKFDRLLDQVQALGADYLATGHYARVEKTDSGFVLRRAVDLTKDQSYVLYHLGQRELSKVLFPLGDYTKMEIREMARRFGLRTADKPDSQEICFVPNNDYRAFLNQEIPAENRPEGEIRHVDGRTLGQHTGLPFYTIGQRQGLGVTVGSPLYVVDMDKASNTLVVGNKEDTLAQGLTLRDVTWSSGSPMAFPAQVTLKIRSRHSDAMARLDVHPGRSDRLVARFDAAQSAITPGQAAVFYVGEYVVGGGTVDHVER